MRTLAPPPPAVCDAAGAIARGSYRGALPPVDLAPLGKGPLYRLTHRKKWLYFALAADPLFVGLAVVDLGYAMSTFAFAFEFERGRGRMLADCSALTHPAGGGVNDTIGEGFSARFSTRKARVVAARAIGSRELVVDADFPNIELHARVDAAPGHLPLSAIGPIPGGVIDATEKHALLPAKGEVRVCGERRSLVAAMAGYDYTHGYLAHHTRWRWAFLLGRTKDGERVGLNLVEGFLGELECGVWIDGELHPLGEGRFTFDASRPLDPWRVRTDDGTVDLAFEPGALHADDTNLGLVRSHFVQPVGVYSGTVAIPGRAIVLERVLGVAEDQDVRW